MFKNIDAYAGDPILSLMETYKQDPRQDRVNLSIGIYYNEQAIIPRMNAVAKAEALFYANSSVHNSSPSYLPIEGLQPYLIAAKDLLFGDDHPMLHAMRIATIQTIGGSGALKVGADFLKSYFPNSQVWVSDPTWPNHIAIFVGAGFKVNKYFYFNDNKLNVDFQMMLRCLQLLPEKSIVLLHPCCHNPTGADLTNEEWDQVIMVIEDRQLIPFIDIAYQGFGVSIDDDAYAIREIARHGLPCLVSHSFSKNFSLYSERVGALSVVCSSVNEAERVLGQLKATVRRSYSSPPNFGAQIVAHVLNNPVLNNLWRQELAAMRQRVISMRYNLLNALKIVLPERNFDYLLHQRGIFSYTGLSSLQITNLRAKYGVYLANNGRLCLAGLNTGNVERVAQAISAVQ